MGACSVTATVYLDLISSLNTRIVCGFGLDLLLLGKKGKLALVLPFVVCKDSWF